MRWTGHRSDEPEQKINYTYDLQNHEIRANVRDDKDTKYLLEVDRKIGQDVAVSSEVKGERREVRRWWCVNFIIYVGSKYTILQCLYF